MVRAAIATPKGQLLINSLDANNDSPVHLAAYRKKLNLFMLFASNNAFLDQPNAAQEDALDALKDPNEKMQVIASLERLPLSESNLKRIAQEKRKMLEPKTEQTADKKTESVLTNPTSTNNEVKEKKEGVFIFDSVMSNQAGYLAPVRKTTLAGAPSQTPPHDDFALKELEFELPETPAEFCEDDEIAVVNLMPGNGFFFVPKTVAFDNI